MKKNIITIILFLPGVLFAQNNQRKATPIKRTQSTDSSKKNGMIRLRCSGSYSKPAIFIYNNQILSAEKVGVYDPQHIEKMSVITSKNLNNLFGLKVETGVVLIYSKDFITYN